MLKNLKVSELYTEGSYCDAQDTTNEFIMAKIIEVKNNEILVNYDGWSTKWNTVSFFTNFLIISSPSLLFLYELW